MPVSLEPLTHPDLMPLIALYPAFDPQGADLGAIRAARKAAMPSAIGLHQGVTVEEHWCESVSEAPLRILLYRPARPINDENLPALLHIHGGGYILGAPETCHAHNIARARDANCVVAAIAYRLAPDTQFPGAIEDCHRALVWLDTGAARLGIDRARIAIGGESAGGGLAAALALLARERGQVKPVFQLLIYPMLDDRTANDRSLDEMAFAIWPAKANRFGWASLLGTQPGQPGVSPFAAAARCADLSGLPPAYVAVGTLDILLKEDVAYAMRLIEAGVPVNLRVYAGACHGFDFLGDTPIGREFIADATAALRAALWPTAALRAALWP